MIFRKKKKLVDRRKYERYGAEAQVHFRVTFDIRTKVKYQIIDMGKEKILSKKYEGMSKDISAEGICFSSPEQLARGDILRIEVFVPQKAPVVMDGEVMWSRPSAVNEYDTGVKLLICNAKPIPETIRYVEPKNMVWSEVLQSIIGDPDTKIS